MNTERVNHPFVETHETDIQVKLKDTTLYLNSNLLNDLTDEDSQPVTSICDNLSNAKSKDGSPGDELENSGLASILTENIVNGNVIDLTEYNSYDVIEFFKHLHPEKYAKFTYRNNFRAILELCKCFKVAWLKDKVEDVLIEKLSSSMDYGELSVNFSLARDFHLHDLEKFLKVFLCNRLKIGGLQNLNKNDAILHIIAQFNLKDLHENFETYFISRFPNTNGKRGRNQKLPTKEDYINLLMIAEYHCFDQLKAFLIKQSYLNTWMEDERLKNLSNSTLFEIAKRLITRILEPGTFSDCFSVMLDYTYLEQFNAQTEEDRQFLIETLLEKCTPDEDDVLEAPNNEQNAEAEIEIQENTLEDKRISQSKSGDTGKQPNHPFTSTSTTDIEVVVGQTTLHLHGSVLKRCSPVFNAMISGTFKEGLNKKINFPNKDVSTMIEFFEFFYPKRKKKLQDSSNLEELLALCQQYQVDWLMKLIEDHIAKNLDFYTDVSEILFGWSCLEKFPQLVTLKPKLTSFKKEYCYLDKMSKADIMKFISLRPTTKYQILKNSLERWINDGDFLVNATDAESLNGVLSFLDKMFLHHR